VKVFHEQHAQSVLQASLRTSPDVMTKKVFRSTVACEARKASSTCSWKAVAGSAILPCQECAWSGGGGVRAR
jgi:hypothetical protein